MSLAKRLQQFFKKREKENDNNESIGKKNQEKNQVKKRQTRLRGKPRNCRKP